MGRRVHGVVKMPLEMTTPAAETPSHALYLSELDLLEQWDMLTFSVYEASEKENNDTRNPARVLKDALPKLLVHYYPFAGRLREADDHGKLEVICNGEGVPFIEAQTSCTLEEVGFFKDPSKQWPIMAELDPEHHSDANRPINEVPLMSIQVTTFACGGFVVGVKASHRMIDGEGFYEFMKAYAEIARGGSNNISVAPVWERERLAPRKEPKYTTLTNLEEEYIPWDEFIERGSSKKPTIFSKIEFPHAFVERLRSSIVEESEGEVRYCSIFEALVAVMWGTYNKHVMTGKQVGFHFVMNTRRVLLGPCKGFYGTCITDVKVKHGDLLCNEEEEVRHSDIVKAIRRAKESVTEEQLRAWIDFRSEQGRKKSLFPAVYLSDDLYFNDWRRLDWTPDFGVGKGVCLAFPLDSLPPNHPCVFLLAKEGCDDDACYPALVALPEEGMAIVKAHIATAIGEI